MSDATLPTLQRLDEQISWYDAKSQRSHQWFKALKLIQLVVAGAIPLVAVFGISAPERVMAVLGLIILIVEGLQQLNQYQALWITYRSTCEALRHEKYLFLGGAGPYAKPEESLAVLAERVEGLITQEHVKWISSTEKASKAAQPDTSTPRG